MAENLTSSEWVTTKQAAALMGYDYAHIRLLVRKGRIKGIKLGRDWLVERESALAYLKEMQGLGSAKHDPWRSGTRQTMENREE